MAFLDMFNTIMGNKGTQNFLATLGAAIGGKGSVGEALGGIVKSGIISDNMAKIAKSRMLQSQQLSEQNKAMVSMLEKEGSKISIEPFTGKVTINTTTGNMGFGDGWAQSETANMSPSGGVQQQPQLQQQPQQQSLPARSNVMPGQFGGGGINPADLAGLTPDMMIAMLSNEATQRNLDIDRMRLEQNAPLIEAQTEALRARTSYERPKVVIPGMEKLGPVSTEDYLKWKALDVNEQKALAATELAGKKLDRQEFRDMLEEKYKQKQIEKIDRDLKRGDVTASIKDYEYAQKNGYEGSFEDWKKELARAGAITIGEAVDKKEALNVVNRKEYFSSPKFQKDIDEYKNSNDFFLKVQGVEGVDKQKAVEQDLVGRFIINRITGAGGKIKDIKASGNIVTFIVEWPSGDTTEVQHGF